MTKLEFVIACGEVLIDPGMALENEDLHMALIQGNDEEVRRILHEDF